MKMYNPTSNHKIDMVIITNQIKFVILSIISCIFLLSLLVPGCENDNLALVGNGFCNDETNNPDCNYDGGDCCAMNSNINSCTECVCHLLETCAAGYHPLVGNGFCHDSTNIVECDYDGGDCCGCVFTEHCDDCACLDNITSGEITNPVVGNSICNDETNNFNCNYDGGDCCVNVNTDSCSECNCLGSGIITSPGFPENYENNLDLTWLIQVPFGQKIETTFLLFELEAHPSCR